MAGGARRGFPFNIAWGVSVNGPPDRNHRRTAYNEGDKFILFCYLPLRMSKRTGSIFNVLLSFLKKKTGMDVKSRLKSCRMER